MSRDCHDSFAHASGGGGSAYRRGMPRIPRHQQLPPWAVVHATARGVERRPIVLDRLDARFFLAQLADVVDRFEWTVHAFCLMPNHYHLLV